MTTQTATPESRRVRACRPCHRGCAGGRDPPWLRPWDVAQAAGPVSRPLRRDGTPYPGVNVLLLWLEAMEQGYAAPFWMTYRQAQALGGQVRKGERTESWWCSRMRSTRPRPTGRRRPAEVEIPYMKGC